MSCRHAREALAQANVPFETRDIFKQPLTAAELRRLAGDRPIAEIFSWKSPTARQQGLKLDDLSGDDLIRLMTEEPRLIRRPIVQAGDRVIIGLDRAAIASLGTG
ncbi:MAG TPA: ArsC/Spx/MgsR family protein [Dehalococcoidia bacterium]|nr:ArsC/Spx/MgsR family protein [Dehalococcoidia bacterium]